MFAADENGHLIRRIHRLGDPPKPEPEPLDLEKTRIKKMIRLVDAGVIYDREMFENLIYDFVSMPDEFWEDCANLLDDTRTALFCKFIDDTLTPVDFEPSPVVFMVQWDPVVAEQKRRELKPIYVALREFWHNHHSRRTKSR